MCQRSKYVKRERKSSREREHSSLCFRVVLVLVQRRCSHNKEKEKREKRDPKRNRIIPDSRSSESSPRTWSILACRRGTRRFRHHHRPRVKTTCLRYCAFTTARVYYTTAKCVYVLREAYERERERDSYAAYLGCSRKKETSFRSRGKKRFVFTFDHISCCCCCCCCCCFLFVRNLLREKRDADEIAEEEGWSERFFVGFDRE